MNNDINIAEILKDCPKGMRLYSPLLGYVALENVDTNSPVSIRVKDSFNSCGYFTKTGLYYDRADGECLLFPSSKMRDWTKFFKKGDILHNKDGNVYVIFDDWEDNNYTEFDTTINCCNSFKSSSAEGVCHTNDFIKASDVEGALFIAGAEKYYDIKYNSNTLRIESIKPGGKLGKLKPFDKVLVRDDLNEKWSINLFSYYDEEVQDFPYVCLSDRYEYCVPYEGNEYFVGKKVNIH